MKYPAYIDTNATSPVTRVGLQWEADTIIVINPTKYTVAVRVGSGSVPDTSNADMIVAPVSALCLPTEAREFTFIATTPTLTDAPDGMPTRVTLYLTKNEPSPAFGSISLAGQLPRAGVLVDTASSAGIVSHPAVVVPPAIRRLMISPHAFSGASARVEIYGNLTGTQYYQGHPGSGLSGHTIVQLSALDTTLDIEYFPETTGAYAIDIIGFTEYGPVGSWGQDGRELVNPVALGATAVPVAVAQLYPALPAPSYDVNGAAFAPGAGAALCTTPALVAGDYLVQCEMGSADPVAAGGKYVFLVHNPGAKHVHYCPVPGHAEFTLARITAAAADVLSVQVGAVGGAGTLYFGAIRAYKIA